MLHGFLIDAALVNKVTEPGSLQVSLELIKAAAAGVDEFIIDPLMLHHQFQYAKGQRCVPAGSDPDVFITAAGGVVTVGVDDHKFGAALSGLHHVGPEMQVGDFDVDPPDDDQIGLFGSLRWGAAHLSADVYPAGPGSGRTDRLLEPRGANFMKQWKPGKAVDHPHVAGVAIGQHRFATMGINHLIQPAAEVGPGLAPADAFKIGCSLVTYPDQWMQYALGSVEPGRIALHFPAYDSPGIGMVRVTLQGRNPAVFNGGDHAAGVGTIKRTDGFLVFFHGTRRVFSSTFLLQRWRILGTEVIVRCFVLDDFGKARKLIVKTIIALVVVDV